MPITDRWRFEGGKIIKVSNGQPIPDDEPVFILRGRDRLAIETLLYYRSAAIGDGCTDYLLDSVSNMIKEFEKFAAEQPNKMKQPGVTRGR